MDPNAWVLLYHLSEFSVDIVKPCWLLRTETQMGRLYASKIQFSLPEVMMCQSLTFCGTLGRRAGARLHLLLIKSARACEGLKAQTLINLLLSAVTATRLPVNPQTASKYMHINWKSDGSVKFKGNKNLILSPKLDMSCLSNIPPYVMSHVNL